MELLYTLSHKSDPGEKLRYDVEGLALHLWTLP